MPAPSQPQMRRFGDYAATNKAVFDNTLAALQQLPPVENSRYRLSLDNLGYQGPETTTTVEHKDALLDGRSLSRRLLGTFSLTDRASGNVIDKRRMTVASVPHLTQQGVFVIDGTAQPISHQMRLDPGIYVRRKASGDVEAHVNVMPGNGVPHRINLDPETGVFKVSVGQADIPAINLLKVLGATDEELKHAWGKELFAINAKSEKPHYLEKLYEKFGPPGKRPDNLDMKSAIGERIHKYNLDSWITNRTLGRPHKNYGKEPLIDTTKKLLAVAHGKAEPDDRDNPAYSTVWGPEHLIAERIARSGPILSRFLWQATNRSSLEKLPAGILTPAIRAVFTKSGLAQTPEGSNALEFVDHGSRITKVGEGGIGRSAESVPDSARWVSPSQIPFIDPVRAAESETVGVDNRVSFGTRIGADKRIYAPLKDVKTGKLVFKSPRDVSDAILAFPNALHSADPVVPVIAGGRLTYAPREDVNYVIPSMEQSFSPLTNLVPMKSAAKPHRSSMGSRMIGQSLSLLNPEAPLVRTAVPGQPDKSFEEVFGRHVGSTYASEDQPGIVEDVKPDAITVRYADGSTQTHGVYNNHPSGRKTGFHAEPIVQPGQSIQPGQMLAKSNFVDDKGHAAYGANARVAFMTMKGKVYEDAILASQSFANRLSSDHLYRYGVEPDPHTMVGKVYHAAAFGGKHSLETLKNVGDDGIVKPGTIVKEGDPLILAVRRKQEQYGRLSRSGKAGFSDASETWDHEEPGVVTDVRQTKNGPVVLVKTAVSAKEGDKLSGRVGNKGVINIIPDEEMPHDEQGRPIEVIISSLGTISRVNPSQIFEAHLGKIAAKTGKPYVIDDFQHDQNIGKFVEEEGRKHNVPFLETLTDPKSGRKIPNVGVGNMYVMKLSHMAAGKVSGRGLGGYDETGQPLRGQSGKAMRASLGDSNALLSHGANRVIYDAHIMKGQSNPEFWLNYMSGFPPARPTVSKAYERFLTEIRSAGIDPVRDPEGRTHLTALTADTINRMAGDRVVQNGETLDLSRNGEPIPGGLFDPKLWPASDNSNTWGKIELHEDILNPVFEDPARRLLGLTEQQFRDTIAGKHKIATGTGNKAIVDAMRSYDVKTEIAKARTASQGNRKTARDEANRKLGYLKTLEETGRTPADWVTNVLPVLPPAFRPVSPGRGKAGVIVHDANLLYGDLINSNKALKELSQEVSDVGAERLNVYDAAKAVAGLGEPVNAKNAERQVKGVLDRLLGSTSKLSYMQQKLLGTPVDLAGRGQVLPSPDLDLDQIGLPEELAWSIYHPFVIRRLVRSGVPRAEAARLADKREPLAKRMLTEEMGERPVLATRYPALHRFNVQAFHPQLVTGKAIQTNSLINRSYNLDHDGDDHHNTVVVSIDKEKAEWLNDPVARSFLEIRKMAARFNATAPALMNAAELYCVRLDDFPHAEYRGTRAHIDFYDVPPGVRVVAYDETRNCPVYAEVSGWSVHRDREVEIVNLLSGRQIVTDDDPRAVYGIDPETLVVRRSRPSEAAGMMVPRVDRFHDESLTQRTVAISRGGNVRTVALSADFGYFCGVMVGNGWITGDKGAARQINLAATDDGVAAAYRTAFATTFGFTPTVTITERETDDPNGCGASRRLSISCTELAQQLEPLFGHTARNKHLPPFFFSGDFAFRKALLEGLMDTDGSVATCTSGGKSQFTANYTTASLRLAQEIQHLCRSLGVMASLSATHTPGKLDFWIVNFSAPDVRALDLRLRHTDKVRRLREAPPSNPCAAAVAGNNAVPIPRCLVDAVRLAIGRAKLVEYDLYTVLTSSRSTRRIPRLRAQRVIEVADGKVTHALWSRFKALVADEATVWDTITGYEKTGVKETGYDLTVPGHETFMSVDGVILSNTMTISVPLHENAVEEAYRKLLPSRNLFSPASFKQQNFLPNMEYVQGLHHASVVDENNPPMIFRTKEEAIRAYRSGEINLGTRVRILGE